MKIAEMLARIGADTPAPRSNRPGAVPPIYTPSRSQLADAVRQDARELGSNPCILAVHRFGGQAWWTTRAPVGPWSRLLASTGGAPHIEAATRVVSGIVTLGTDGIQYGTGRGADLPGRVAVGGETIVGSMRALALSAPDVALSLAAAADGHVACAVIVGARLSTLDPAAVAAACDATACTAVEWNKLSKAERWATAKTAPEFPRNARAMMAPQHGERSVLERTLSGPAYAIPVTGSGGMYVAAAYLIRSTGVRHVEQPVSDPDYIWVAGEPPPPVAPESLYARCLPLPRAVLGLPKVLGSGTLLSVPELFMAALSRQALDYANQLEGMQFDAADKADAEVTASFTPLLVP